MAHLIYDIDKGLSSITMGVTGPGLILARDNFVDPRDGFVRRKGMTGQATAGRCAEVDGGR